MSVLNKTRIWLILIFAISFNDLQAQNRKDLEEKRIQLIEEINQTTNLLAETKKDKAATLDQFIALQSQIRKRQQLINTLQKELQYANESIARANQVMLALNADIERLKKEYGNMIRSAFRQKMNKSALAFLFSANNLNDAFRRWQYLKQYDRFRKRQAQLILETQGTLQAKAQQLEDTKLEKQKLLRSQEKQTLILNQELTAKNKILKKLKSSESRLVAALDEQQQAHDKLNNAIEAIILKEMVSKRKEARTSAALANTEEKVNISPVVSGDFVRNKGRLPWPVKSGDITRYFGTQPHPTIKSVQIANNGIDIRTEKHSDVLAVFEGKVVGIQFIPGYKNTIIVQHGIYYTVYSNLDQIYVKRGDNINVRQSIGKVGKDKPELHFEIWKEKQRLNPVNWVQKK